MEQTLISYLKQEVLDTDGELGLDDDLLVSGVVDSIAVMRFVMFIEERFGVAVPPEDLTIENFSTVRAIARYLRESGAS